jgi:4-hydroxythreonine-4-phosphate dehydrogenase
MGDACGVGPELLLGAWKDGVLAAADLVAFGDLAALQLANEKLGLDVEIHVVDAAGAADDRVEGKLNLVDLGVLSGDEITIGAVSPACGEAAVRYVQAAVSAALDGGIDGFCTLPINKEAARHAFADFEGHTELIAGICGVRNYTMMLAAPELICTHVSTHVPLREAIERVKTARILEVVRLTHETVRRLRPQARIAVAGLNPHAGEHGAFGDEDAAEILPAVEQARAEGIDAFGPVPPDTLFMKAVAGDYDAVVCMYHDQGHIPMKLHGFADAVNVTVGLPIIRTSVDHGTAFDIAYQGVASTQNLVNAFEMAAQLAGSGD